MKSVFLVCTFFLVKQLENKAAAIKSKTTGYEVLDGFNGYLLEGLKKQF